MKRAIRKVHQRHRSTLNELNITPLLDLVFVLLLIFIITTPQLVNNLEPNLPSRKPPLANAPRPKVNTVAVSETGTILLNDQAVTLAQLKETLARSRAADPETGVVVKGSGEADYQKVVDVLDVLHQLQITKVGLATEVADAPAQ